MTSPAVLAQPPAPVALPEPSPSPDTASLADSSATTVAEVVESPDVPAPIDVPAPTASDDHVSLAMPRIVIEGNPAPDANVPDEVADAVRRALKAIENAATSPTTLPQIDLAPITMPDLQLPSIDADDELGADVSSAEGRPTPSADAQAVADPTEPALEPPVAAPPSGFGPPTVDSRAEIMYARAAAEATAGAVDQSASPAAPIDVEPAPEPGQTSVVFVDEDDEPGAARKGALRRLIGSLRKHD